MTHVRRYGPIAARTLLGLLFVVFGLNYFLHFLPTPPSHEGPAATFLGGLAAAGYFFPFLKGTEVLAGIALLSGRFVPLALTVLAPVILQIALYHTLLAPGPAMAAVLLVLELYLAWAYRDSFRALLAPNAQPSRGDDGLVPRVGRSRENATAAGA